MKEDKAALLPDTVTEAPTRQRYVVMVFLCVLSFLTYFDRLCIMRAKPDIAHDLQLSNEQWGLILGAFWLAYALFEIPGGWMGDRWGSRVTLTRIVLAWSVLTILSGASVGFVSLLLYRFLFGAGEAGAYPNMARVQANWLPVGARARAGGLLWLLARWGGAFSPLLFGLMLRGFGSHAFQGLLAAVGLSDGIHAWRLAFWAAGLIGLVWCLGFYPWFRDDPAAVPSVNAAELRLIRAGGAPAGGGRHRMPARAWGALLLSRDLWAIGLLYLFGSFGWSFVASWLPDYFKEVHHVTYENSELVSGLPLFFGGISCLVGGALSDALVRRTGRKWLGRAVFPISGFLTAALAMYCLRFTHDANQATVLLCVAFAAHDFGQGANWASIVDVGGRYAGTAAGFINMVGNNGNAVGPYVGAVIKGHLGGWNVLLAVYSAAFLVAASMWLFINPNRTFYAHVTESEKETEAVSA
jgi:ACS family glucarate transporter-like MFS transporter